MKPLNYTFETMKSKTVDRLLKSPPKDVEVFVDLYADLVVRINQILREKGISKKELAERLDKQPSEISKWLGGEHNFTLRSIAKLSAELGEHLLEVPARKSQPVFIDGYVQTTHSFVVRRRMDSIPKQDTTVWQLAAGHNTLSNVG
jgi:transcriptional regulator with XRE-family HTH domain